MRKTLTVTSVFAAGLMVIAPANLPFVYVPHQHARPDGACFHNAS
jgi:hypothetical protein